MTITLGATTSSIDAQFPEGGQILGTVTNATTKAPVAWDQVCVRESDVECVWTNADGEYILSGLPGGEYRVSFEGPEETYVSPQYYKNVVYTEPDKVRVPHGGVVKANIDEELEEYSRIGGRVINAAERLAAYVRALVFEPQRQIEAGQTA